MIEKEYEITESGNYAVSVSDSSNTYEDSLVTDAVVVVIPRKVLKINNCVCAQFNNKYVNSINDQLVQCGKINI